VAVVQQTPERQRLLALVADLILENGMLDLSLSGIARHIGSNNRMLLYYFGSKENLLDEAALVAMSRFPRLNDMITRLGAPGDLESRLQRAWSDIGTDENWAYLQMFFQRFGLALRDHGKNDAFLQLVGTGWVRDLQAILEREGYSESDARIAATQLVAAWRGLQFAMLSGVEREVLDAAYQQSVRALLAWLNAPAALTQHP
jgi:AcrR family transcriptional regulator